MDVESQLLRMGLTPTQLMIVLNLCKGLSTLEISANSGRSYKTVKSHLSEAYKAFGMAPYPGRSKIAKLLYLCWKMDPDFNRVKIEVPPPPEESISVEHAHQTLTPGIQLGAKR